MNAILCPEGSQKPPRRVTGGDRGRYRFFSNNSHLKILVQFDGIRAGLYKHCRSERGQAVSYNYRQVLGVLLSLP